MSNESAIRFLILKEKDEAIKRAFDAIMAKIDAEEPSWDKAIQEEVIPLAKKYGYDLSPEDFKALKKTAPERLEDEELDMVAGGRGQRQQISYYLNGWKLIDTEYCDLAPDNQTFMARYNRYPDSGCPDYSYSHGCPIGDRHCLSCKNLQFQHTEGYFD
jgi:hypothetical protein